MNEEQKQGIYVPEFQEQYEATTILLEQLNAFNRNFRAFYVVVMNVVYIQTRSFTRTPQPSVLNSRPVHRKRQES